MCKIVRMENVKENCGEIINLRLHYASIANAFDVEIPIARRGHSSEIGFRGDEVNVRRGACSKGSASIDEGEIPGMRRGPHLLHHELWPTHGRSPTHPSVTRRPPSREPVFHFHRKFTLMAFALHTSCALCKRPEREKETAIGQLRFISWCGRVRGFQMTRYTGLSWAISAVFLSIAGVSVHTSQFDRAQSRSIAFYWGVRWI